MTWPLFCHESSDWAVFKVSELLVTDLKQYYLLFA